MPDITIQPSTLERLKRLAEPLVDDADAVVCRALDALERLDLNPPDKESLDVDREIRSSRLPDLTHSKVQSARIGNEVIEKPNWNRLLDKTVILAMRQEGTFERLLRTCPANIVQGKKVDEGYHHLREIDVSVQGLSANDACVVLIDTVRRIGVSLEIVFRWRDKDGAAYPGETGRLRMKATTNGE